MSPHEEEQRSIHSPLDGRNDLQDFRMSRIRTVSFPLQTQLTGESIENSEDDDDEAIDDKRGVLCEELNSSTEYTSLNLDTEQRFARDFGRKIKKCVIDKANDEKTLLHFLAIKLMARSFEKVPIKLLVKYVLTNEKDILTQVNNNHNTPLHVAIIHRQYDLIRFICKEADKNELSKAIGLSNEKRQTCLHLAIAACKEQDKINLDIIRILVDKADPMALSTQRNRVGDPRIDLGNQNTALHDFVHIDRCMVLARTCTLRPGECRKCKSVEESNEQAREQFEKDYIETLEEMSKKCPEAMQKLNDAGESPYLYHCSTRSKAKDVNEKEWRDLEFDDEDTPSRSSPANEKVTPGPREKASWAQKDTAGQREKALEKTNGANRKEKIVGPQLPKHSKAHTKAGYKLSKLLAIKVARKLLEHSLSQPTYSSACTSLFGKRQPRSDLAFKAYPLTDKTQIQHSKLPLERILSHVELTLKDPPMASRSIHSDTTHYAVDAELVAKLRARDARMELVEDFFDWLRDVKKVKRIVKLVVIDNEDFPCTDETIEKCLSKFDIRYLDWDKDDICIQTLKDHASNLRELWVSWSGRNSTLFGWLNKEHGLKCLKQLGTLHFTISPGRESEGRNQRNMENFVEKLGQRDNAHWIKVEDPDSRMTRSDSESNDHSAPRDSDMWMKAIDGFTAAINKKITKGALAEMKPITVGLIDDGVKLEELPHSNFSEHGWYADSASPARGSMNTWYTSEEGHGTQMARLICHMCPRVNIFVGKLDTKTRVYTSVAESAVKAIDAAIRNNATIISMSWTMYESVTVDNSQSLRQLNTKIENEGSRGKLLYCACEDQGRTGNEEKPYPASSNTKSIKRIGSARLYGTKSEFVNSKDVDYLFPGELSGKEGRSGSSAATALASGLAALVLWCAEAHRAMLKVEGKEIDEDFDFQKEDRMHLLFDALKKDNKFVNITGMLQEAARDPDPIGEFVRLCKAKIPDAFKKKHPFKIPALPTIRKN